jgi:hypothetical protein
MVNQMTSAAQSKEFNPSSTHHKNLMPAKPIPDGFL